MSAVDHIPPVVDVSTLVDFAVGIEVERVATYLRRRASEEPTLTVAELTEEIEALRHVPAFERAEREARAKAVG